MSTGARDTAPACTALTHPHALLAHEGDAWAPALFAEESEPGDRYDPYVTFRPADHEGR